MTFSFPAFARRASALAGNPRTFAATCVLIALWASAGPVCHYSDTWQLVANTATTLATTLLVLLVQNSQTRDTIALQKKLDEVIRALPHADNELVEIEKKD